MNTQPTSDDENPKNEFRKIMNKLEQIDEKLSKMIENKEKENQKLEKMLDNTDMCLLLGITKRTLQRYRQKGVVPYYMMKAGFGVYVYDNCVR